MRLKLGIIGLGRMGKHHARVSQMIPEVELIAIADIHQIIKPDFIPSSVLFTQNYKDLFNLVDAVIIATPTATHYTITNDFLSANIHVLLEKPIAPTLHEATKLFDKAIQKNRTLHIGHVERFNPAFTHYNSNISHRPFFIESSRKTPFMPHIISDSVLLDLMIHDIDLVLQLIDSAVENIEVIGKKVYSKNFDISTAHIEFSNGSHAFFHATRIAQMPKRTMVIHTKNNIFRLDFMEQSIESDALEADNKVKQIFKINKENALLLEIKHFIHAINSKTDVLNGIKDLTTLQVTLDLQKKLMT